jgi:RNA polymerase-binding protein DksA
MALEPSRLGETQRMLETMLRQRRTLLQEAPEARSASTDPVDVAQDLEEELTCLAVLERGRELRAQAEEAFSRLVEGQYGYCTVCSKRIPAARLRAFPCAVRCLACQERFEAHGRVLPPRLSSWRPVDEA